MSTHRGLILLEDPRFLEHRGPDGHPERPERLAGVGAALEDHREGALRIAPREADPGELLRVHTRSHLSRLYEAQRRAPVQLDADTYLGAASLGVAHLAAGGVIDLLARVAERAGDIGWAAVRPPGHHAETDRAMGFCLLNNVAVAARALQDRGLAERVLIVDWDVHHGNGTQHTFDDDPSVLFFSTHQFPYYPGTGDNGETGGRDGKGTTVNVPMPAGCGDAEYVGVMQRILAPTARWFRPDFILVSCGFDAHRVDPLASMEVTGNGYGAMASILRSLADELCGGRLAFVLEGGYALEGLETGTRAVLAAARAPSVEPGPIHEAPAGSLLRLVADRVVAVHGGRIPGLGAA